MTALNQLEPGGLIAAFGRHPPAGFATKELLPGVPAFDTRFDVLTTASSAMRARVRALPFYRRWQNLTRPRTLFVGTTVSEYVLLDEDMPADRFIAMLKEVVAPRYPILIIKDIPHNSPILGASANDQADARVKAARAAGFVIVQGQALAYVPIDFDSIDSYLSRLSAARRKNIRRKLRSRSELDIEVVPTGAACFEDDALRERLYALYLNVYRQSDVQFDLLSAEFFAKLLRARDDGGVVFVYRHSGELIGYNLCYVRDGRLIDKYIGLAYPQARNANLYFVSWIQNLEYALKNRLDTYVAGWTDPQVKAELGAHFTYTRHAVHVRNRLLRTILRMTSPQFEADRAWGDASGVPQTRHP